MIVKRNNEEDIHPGVLSNLLLILFWFLFSIQNKEYITLILVLLYPELDGADRTLLRYPDEWADPAEPSPRLPFPVFPFIQGLSFKHILFVTFNFNIF